LFSGIAGATDAALKTGASVFQGQLKLQGRILCVFMCASGVWWREWAEL